MFKGKRYDMDMDTARMLNNNFKYHKPAGTQNSRYEKIRDMAKDMAWFICEQCPPSRERSLAITNLEQAVMWANASIARNEK
jgi:hypothetical protein